MWRPAGIVWLLGILGHHPSDADSNPGGETASLCCVQMLVPVYVALAMCWRGRHAKWHLSLQFLHHCACARLLFCLCLFCSLYGAVELAELVLNWFRAGALLMQSGFHVGSTCVPDSMACRRVQYSYFQIKKCSRRLPGAELVLTGALPTGAERRAVGCNSWCRRVLCRRSPRVVLSEQYFCFLITRLKKWRRVLGAVHVPTGALQTSANSQIFFRL